MAFRFQKRRNEFINEYRKIFNYQSFVGICNQNEKEKKNIKEMKPKINKSDTLTHSHTRSDQSLFRWKALNTRKKKMFIQSNFD